MFKISWGPQSSNPSYWILSESSCMQKSTPRSALSSIGTRMKSRLPASVSTLFSGKQRRIFSKVISISSPNATLFNGKCRNFSSFQNQRFEDLGRAMHDLSSEDDFSELGPPVAGTAATQLKLMTEKPEPFMKTDPAGKASASRCSLRDIYLSLDKTSQGSKPKFHKHCDVNWKNSKVNSSSCFMSNDNILDGLDCCEVDFEISESSGADLPNHPLHTVKKVAIRIQGIGKETTDPRIHSICKAIGALEGFERVDKDSVDALFRVTNDTNARDIVQRLNHSVIDDCHWAAYLIPRDTSSTLPVSEEVGSELGIRVNSGLIEWKKQFDSKKIDFEDLIILHMGIMHLEGLPTISNPFDQD